jgi:ABC-type transport system involved in multi-copper enzyme maturation permease subunit
VNAPARPRPLDDFLTVARLDLAEVVRSRWLIVCLGLYGVLATLFVLVGLHESTVMGFTGMGRVLFSLCHALLLLLPLVALAVTGQVVNRARDDGALELLLSHPIRRTSYLAAVTVVRFAALTLPLVALLLALGGLGHIAFGQAVPWHFIARASALCASLIWAFTALGIAISVRVRSPARAMTALIVAWALGVALLDFGLIGLMLTWRIEPHAVFVLAAANPVQAVRMALLSAAQPDLATLGPVGFYLANRFGPNGLMALGLGWPVLFGALAWLVGLRGLRRGDLV